jgi:tetratricopeptide (TPR) repeat protein
VSDLGGTVEILVGAFPRVIALTKTIRFMIRGEYRSAEAVMVDIVRRYPSRGRLHAILADIMLFQLHYEDALRISLDGIRLKSKPDAKLLTCLGRANAGLGQFDNAKKAFQEALAASPVQSTLITSAYAACLNDSGQNTEAIQMLQSGLKRSPRDIRLLTELSRAYIDAGNKEEATKVLRSALGKNPKSLPLKSMLVNLLAESDRRPEARQLLAEIVKSSPKKQYAREWICMVQLCLFQFARSAKTCDEILAHQRDIIRFPVHMGSILERQGRLEEARMHFAAALQTPKETGFSILNRGLALLRLGRHVEAIEIFEHALSRWPLGYEGAMILVNWSVALREMGKTEEALQKAESAVKEDPTLVNAASVMGDALRERNRLDEAQDMYERAIGLEPGYTEAYLGLAKVQSEKGNHHHAFETISRALEIEPLHQKSKDFLTSLNAS